MMQVNRFSGVALCAVLLCSVGCGDDSGKHDNNQGTNQDNKILDPATYAGTGLTWGAVLTGAFNGTAQAGDSTYVANAVDERSLELDHGNFFDGTPAEIEIKVRFEDPIEIGQPAAIREVTVRYKSMVIDEPDYRIYILNDSVEESHFSVVFDDFDLTKTNKYQRDARGRFSGTVVNEDDSSETLTVEGVFDF